jgi:aconitate hydratase 2/2-methylisocitrate dehydratase
MSSKEDIDRMVGDVLAKWGELDTLVNNAGIWTYLEMGKMDAAQLMREGYYAIFVSFGGRTEMPGCSLCMGNQARVGAGTTVFATSTRNFDHRLGDNTRVYLGSSELAALTALLGRVPTVDEYMAVMKEKVLPRAAEIYRYLQFDKMGDFSLGYVR